MWNSAQREILISTFQEFFASIKEKDWALCYNSMMFWDFPNHSKFLKILSLKLFDNSWRNLCIPCVLLRITLHATCGKKKIWKRIQKSQNIMSGIVWIFFFFAFYIFINSFRCSEQWLFSKNLQYLSKNPSGTQLGSLSILKLCLSEKIGKVVIK